MKVIICGMVTSILLSVFALSSHAQDNGWQERLRQHEQDFNKMKKEHHLIYRMVSELYIKRMGYKKYEKLVLTPEVKNER